MIPLKKYKSKQKENVNIYNITKKKKSLSVILK